MTRLTLDVAIAPFLCRLKLKARGWAMVQLMVHMKTHPLVCTYPSRSFMRRSSSLRLLASFVTCPESGIDEPTTGPLYWEKRRAEWLKEPTEPQTHPREEDNLSGSKARARLEEMLAAPFAEEDDMIWSGTLNAIWRGFSRGDRLKKNLPLPIVVCNL